MRVGKGMDIQECYRILEVDQGAEWMEIRKSFYRLPGKIKDGQSFILKSKPQSQGEKVNHHILVIELV